MVLSSNSEANTPSVGANSYLTLHYRVEFLTGPAAGTTFVDTFASRPATLQMGVGQWSQAMETPLIGMKEGDQIEFDLPASQAYGDYNPDLVQQISKQLLQKNSESGSSLELGEVVEFAPPQGGRYSGVIKQIFESEVLIDFNHPLAGHNIRVEVYLLGVL